MWTYAFITPFTEKPDYLTNTRIRKVERETETPQAYFYDPVGTAPATPKSPSTPKASALTLRPCRDRSPSAIVQTAEDSKALARIRFPRSGMR